MVDFLVMLYGISTLIDYLMPNPVYIYILNKHFKDDNPVRKIINKNNVKSWTGITMTT